METMSVFIKSCFFFIWDSIFQSFSPLGVYLWLQGSKLCVVY